MVTITGLGGSGKTRLALEVARAFASPASPPPEQPFPDGIFLVSLSDPTPDAPVVSSTGSDTGRTLVTMLHAALTMRAADAAEMLPRVVGNLTHRALLLVVDGYQATESGAAVFSELLAQAPQIKLLVTARVPLHLAEERVLHVDGLELPPNADMLETAEASALFLQEARRASLAFELTEQERPHLTRLCRLLGGFPLALVLAARWAPILPCSAIAIELECGLGLDVLGTTDTDLPERHRSLTRILETALAQLPGDDHLNQLLDAASSSRDDSTATTMGVPRELVPQLRVLDEQALLRVDRVRGTVELHPLLRPYAMRRQAEASLAVAAPVRAA
jgi:predicted ATPase